MRKIDISTLGELSDLGNQIDQNEALHSGDDKTLGDGKLTTESELNLFYDYIRQSDPSLSNMSNEELATSFEDSSPSTLKKILNPESTAMNWILGAKQGDDKFKSYLNPLASYSGEKKVGTAERWADPLMTTLDANFKDGQKHFGHLNPVHTIFSKTSTGDEHLSKWGSVVDPGLSFATSFIKNKDTANKVRWILNPIGTAIGKIF